MTSCIRTLVQEPVLRGKRIEKGAVLVVHHAAPAEIGPHVAFNGAPAEIGPRVAFNDVPAGTVLLAGLIVAHAGEGDVLAILNYALAGEGDLPAGLNDVLAEIGVPAEIGAPAEIGVLSTIGDAIEGLPFASEIIVDGTFKCMNILRRNL
ncbi:hypothetical protein AKG34_04840 [Peribacillus butanolivorans]|uniref:hypothetical protein n=1 Tax=Peribacillus butanolivorans TaxID=421767 RepID=UPI0006A74BB2|nr:hypothetical protein [Peribacillus butanolivorans]KON68207.1 hypothetical protein AKG34_04840 [Peribacillus butanolivorans]